MFFRNNILSSFKFISTSFDSINSTVGTLKIELKVSFSYIFPDFFSFKKANNDPIENPKIKPKIAILFYLSNRIFQ